MFDLEKQLQCLPKGKLSLRADLRIRWKLYVLVWQKRTTVFHGAFVFKTLYRSVAIILLLAFSATCTYAYSSPQVTRQSALYPLKRQLEGVVVDLSFGAAAKAVTYAKLADRRLAEADVISRLPAKDAADPAFIDTIKEAEEFVGRADFELSLSEGAKAKPEVDKRQAGYGLMLAGIAQNVGINAEESKIDTVALALDRVYDGALSTPKERPLPSFRHAFPQTEESVVEPANEIDEISGVKPRDMAEKPDTNKRSDNEKISSPENVSEIEKNIISNGAGGFVPDEADNNNGGDKKDSSGKIDLPQNRIAQEDLRSMITKVEDLKKDLAGSEYDQDDVTNLVNRLEQKIGKAREDLDRNDLKDFSGVLKSTDALTNSAKYFIKKQEGGKNASQIDSTVNDGKELGNPSGDEKSKRKK